MFFFILILNFIFFSESLFSSESKDLYLENIVVKSTRSQTNIYQLGSSLNIITSKQISDRGYTFVNEALEGISGLTINQAGAFGGTATLRIRGASSDQTLVLVDGVSVNDPSSPGGGFDFSNYLTSNIERIEILKSSQSTLWGSDAIGGIINIITKDLKLNPMLNFVLEKGSHETTKLGSNFNIIKDSNKVLIAANLYSSKGISKAEKKDGNSEKDGFGSKSYLIKTSHDFFKTKFSTNLNYTESDIDFDSYGFVTGVQDGDENTKAKQFNWNLSAKNLSLDNNFTNTFMYGYSKITRRYFSNNIQNFFAEGKRDFFRYVGNYNINKNNFITYGFEKEDLSAVDFSFETKSFFMLYEVIPFNGLGLSFGVREDKRKNSSNKSTSKITAFLDLSENWRLTSNWGEGFKLPTIFQSTFYCCGGLEPNKQLLPEISEGYEFGLNYNSNRIIKNLNITYFNQKISNLIDFSYLIGSYENIKKVISDGLEFNFILSPNESIIISGNISYTDANNELGLRLFRIPKNKAKIDMDFLISEKTKISFSTYYNGSELDSRSNIDEWVRSDLTFSRKLNKGKELYLKVKNIFDEDYQDVYGYGTEGLSIYIGLRLNYN
ncbi:MAG: TonB-dependent receptor [Pseudomonadota bacterium]|nr:TonB-dependent receptor [Pseudomonadota bacterium]